MKSLRITECRGWEGSFKRMGRLSEPEEGGPGRGGPRWPPRAVNPPVLPCGGEGGGGHGGGTGMASGDSQSSQRWTQEAWIGGAELGQGAVSWAPLLL